MTKEDRVTGRVHLSTYVLWFAAAFGKDTDREIVKSKDGGGGGVGCLSRGTVLFVTILLLSTAAQFTRMAADLWIAWWSEGSSPLFADDEHDDTFHLTVVAGIVAAGMVLAFLRSLTFFDAAFRSSRCVHDTAFTSIMRAPVNLYFDVTPIGRVLNRFSSDIGAIDYMVSRRCLRERSFLFLFRCGCA
jgi:ABC-type multidrug transport system fused ATPase/permease subunit